MKIYVSQVEKIMALGIIGDDTKKIINIFLEAINDWPNTVLTFDDFESSIYKLIKKTTNKSNIEAYLRGIDLSREAWISESLIQILGLYQFYNDDKSLKEIISDLKKKTDFPDDTWYK